MARTSHKGLILHFLLLKKGFFAITVLGSLSKAKTAYRLESALFVLRTSDEKWPPPPIIRVNVDLIPRSEFAMLLADKIRC